MPRTATSARYTYIDCPSCKQGIAQPFSRYSGPIPFVHSHGNRRCRLIVWPEPNGGEHRAWELPGNVSLEDGVNQAVGAALDGGWLHAGYPALATAA